MRALGVVAFIGLFAMPASAAPFTWVVQGTISTVSASAPAGPFTSTLHPGDVFDWWLTFDSAATDLDRSADCGQYAAILAMSFRHGALTLSQPVVTGQDYLLKAGSYGAGSACATLVPPSPDTARIRAGFDSGLLVSWQLAGAFATDALPTDPTAISPAGSLDFFYGGFNNPIASGSVTAIRAVPEPAGTGLLLAGMAALLRRRRSRAGRPACEPGQNTRA